jgi:predicted outer membrane repeat protein
VWNGAQLNIDSTSFVGNVAKTGGAVYLTSVSVLTLTNSSLSANSTSSDGGALYNAGTASLDDVMLQDNHSDFGGAIENGGTLSVARSTLYGNTGIGDGGAIENIGALALTNSMLLGNSTGDDGAGLNNPGTATVSGSTFSGNWSLTGVGGAMRNDGMATIINSTLRGNSAPQGGGIWHRGSLVTSTLNLKNTIVANSPSGGNCYKYPDSTTPITSLGYNLSSDDSCNGYFTQGTDWNTANPNLGPLASNGGPTLTQIPFPLPFPGNKAIDGGNGCTPTDQRGISRPQGGACDIGAVEYVSGEKSPWLYLPLTVR